MSTPHPPIPVLGPPVGGPGTAPPASIPLSFFAAGAAGLVGAGFATWLAADLAVVAPTHPGVVSAVHVAVLACLSTVVLGAMHQFGPVVGRRPLRSVAVARVTLVAMVLGSWMLPSGFAHGPESLVLAGGILVSLAILLAVWNLSRPLSARDGGVPVLGLRLALGYLVLTASFGVLYAIDRQTAWFPLLPNRVLAHAHLGLLGWMGLTYLAVAEKLWPMFLLAHRPSQRSGRWAIGLVAPGTLALATGLLFALQPVAVLGGIAVVGGLAAHVWSLVESVRHRRRGLELLHAWLFASTGFLIAAVGLGVVGGLAPMSYATRSQIVTAEVAALIMWLALAVLGHAHKIVPFISYSGLRARGIRTNRSGGPLMFADLYDPRIARVSFLTAVSGAIAVVVGLAFGSQEVLAVGGALISLSGVVTTANLATGPRRGAGLPESSSPPAARATSAPTAGATSSPIPTGATR